jgi:putative transposase
VDKYSEKEKLAQKKIRKQKAESENRGSAVPQHMKGYPLKLDALLS